MLDVYFIFEALDQSALAEFSKSWGGIFALIQTLHLSAMALLGGMILVSDLRLLNVLMTNVSIDQVMDSTRRWIGYALIVMVLTGIYMASAVAIKLYYNEFFWSKMAGLAMGIGFFYTLKFPLLRHHPDKLNPWSIRLIALASLLIWFSVAASGRWIGFS